MDVNNYDFSKARQFGIISTFIVTIFSFLGLIIAQTINSVSKNEKNLQEMKDSFLESGIAIEETEAFLDFMNNFSTILLIAMYIYLALGIIGLFYLFKLKDNTTKKVSIFLIVSAILHFVFFRYLAFILLLLSGLKLKKYSKKLT